MMVRFVLISFICVLGICKSFSHCFISDLDFEIPASLQAPNTVVPEIKLPAKRGYVDLDTPESSDAHTAKKQHR